MKRVHSHLQIHRNALALAATVIWMISVTSALRSSDAAIPKAPVPQSPYIAVVYRYADAMLEKGRDTYGPQKTGLFLSALDRTTLAPLTNRPTAPASIREVDRVGVKSGPLVGANPQHDENLLRLLYLVSDLTAKPKHRDAANAGLKWFLQNAKAPATDLLPWGERQSWDVLVDQPIVANDNANGAHSFLRPWLLWERCFEVAPEDSKRVALGLSKNVTADSPRQAGFLIRTWSTAYAQTKDDQFLAAIEALLQRCEQGRRSATGSIFANAKMAAALSLAIECDGAAHFVPEPLASRLRALAAREDETFCTLPHELKKARGFVSGARPTESSTPLWNVPSGGYTTAQVGMMCVSRYDNTGKIGCRGLLVAAADAYLNSLPADGEDVWPGTFGHVISLQVAAWRHTAKPVYLESARVFADTAIKGFFGTNALPRASLKSEHYESITGADTLVLALAELHLQVLHITAVRCPPNTIDR
jgi:hypothetical protein